MGTLRGFHLGALAMWVASCSSEEDTGWGPHVREPTTEVDREQGPLMAPGSSSVSRISTDQGPAILIGVWAQDEDGTERWSAEITAPLDLVVPGAEIVAEVDDRVDGAGRPLMGMAHVEVQRFDERAVRRAGYGLVTVRLGADAPTIAGKASVDDPLMSARFWGAHRSCMERDEHWATCTTFPAWELPCELPHCIPGLFQLRTR